MKLKKPKATPAPDLRMFKLSTPWEGTIIEAASEDEAKAKLIETILYDINYYEHTTLIDVIDASDVTDSPVYL